MASHIGIRDGGSTVAATATAEANGGFYSPAKGKAANRNAYINRSPPVLLRRACQWFSSIKLRLLLGLIIVCATCFVSSRLSYLMGWVSHNPSSVYSPSRAGYTVLINMWKKNSPLKKTVAHYASCSGTMAIHMVWSEDKPPSDNLKDLLEKTVSSMMRTAKKPNLKFNIREEENLNNRFKPIEDLDTDAIFSVDTDVIVPCSALDFGFAVWQTAPSTMVGFVPRMHWLDKGNNGVEQYKYGGWWSVWWMGTYSMVLPKAAFFHRKYLDLYTHQMPSTIHDYVNNERNCEDIAMSLLVANATGAPPIWVKGKIYQVGSSSSIRRLKQQNRKRTQCLNDVASFYGTMPLVPTTFKAVDARLEWFW